MVTLGRPETVADLIRVVHKPPLLVNTYLGLRDTGQFSTRVLQAFMYQNGESQGMIAEKSWDGVFAAGSVQLQQAWRGHPSDVVVFFARLPSTFNLRVVTWDLTTNEFLILPVSEYVGENDGEPSAGPSTDGGLVVHGGTAYYCDPQSQVLPFGDGGYWSCNFWSSPVGATSLAQMSFIAFAGTPWLEFDPPWSNADYMVRLGDGKLLYPTSSAQEFWTLGQPGGPGNLEFSEFSEEIAGSNASPGAPIPGGALRWAHGTDHNPMLMMMNPAGVELPVSTAEWGIEGWLSPPYPTPGGGQVASTVQIDGKVMVIRLPVPSLSALPVASISAFEVTPDGGDMQAMLPRD